MIQNILNFLKKLIPIDLDSMVLESSENESNVYQKYGVAAAAGTAVALFSLFLMAFLIATGEVQLDEIKTRKIVVLRFTFKLSISCKAAVRHLK